MLKLTKFLKPYKFQLILGPLAKLLEASFELILPLIMASLIDKGIPSKDTNYIIVCCLIMSLLIIFGFGFSLFCQYSASVAGMGFGKSLRQSLMKKINSVPYSALEKFGAPSLTNRITADVNNAQVAVAMFIRLVLRAPFICVGGLVMAIIVDPMLSLFLAAFIPLFIVLIIIIMKKTVPRYKKAQKALDSLAGSVKENLTGTKVIRAYNRTKTEAERFEVLNSDWQKNAERAGRVAALMSPATSLIMNIAITVILCAAGIGLGTSVSSGNLIAFIYYVTQIMLAMIVFANLTVIFTRASASAARINEILELQDAPPAGTAQDFDYEQPALSFEGVSFSYGTGGKAVENISFDLKKGHTVGIIGGTGAGKSTIANLILGIYSADCGQIKIFGRQSNEYCPQFLKGRISIVLQKAVLFSGSLRQNLKIGNPNATDQEIERALEIAQIGRFVKKLPKGLDTNVNQGGTNFSGGQRQRFTIARALVSNPELIVFDDSASALDILTDRNVFNAVRENFEQTAMVVISQRISAIKELDDIIVLDGGKIIARGQHKDLLEQCSLYREVFDSQSRAGL